MEETSKSPADQAARIESAGQGPKVPSKASRRGFVTSLGVGGLGVLLAESAAAVTVGPLNPTQRRDRAFQIRVDQATANRNATNTTLQPTNGDEERHANKIGNYTKGLPHDPNTAEVNINA